MKSIKAQAHVEMVLATTLFIGFLIFAFVFLNSSLKVNPDIPTAKIRDAIVKDTSSSIGKLSVILKKEDSCFSLEEVQDLYGNNFKAKTDPLIPTRVTIYYGEIFGHGTIDCNQEKKDKFTLGAYNEEEYIIREKISDLVNSYNSNYLLLKQNLGVEDFSFQFKDINNNPLYTVNEKIPDGVDVTAVDFPVRVIDNNADIEELILNIKAWRT